MALTHIEALAELNDPANAVKYSTTEGLLDLIRRTNTKSRVPLQTPPPRCIAVS